MKKLLVSLAVIISSLLLPNLSNAQSPQDSIKSRIETIDGNEYIGIIQEQTPEMIRLKTDQLGEITILTTDIKKISEISQVLKRDGTYWLDNPQATRYFWSPNAYNLKKGEGYYQNVWIMGNQAIYGITNQISAGVGTVPLFMFGGAPTPVWVTTKFSVPVIENKLNVGAGALVGTVIGEDDTSFGILYGITTVGSKDRNINIGVGWAFGGGEIAKIPTVNVSAMIRTGPKGYFLTENYFVGTTNEFIVITSVGGRRIIKQTGLDFGVFIPIGADIGSFVAIPWLGFTIPF